MLKSVIFDMDGVLVNSEPLHYQAFVRTLAQWGKVLTYEEYKKYIGTTNAVINEGLVKTYDLPISPEDFNEIMKKHKADVYAEVGYPGIAGVPEMLRSFKEAGYTMAVASSSPYENIVKVTKALGIYEYFDQLVSAESVANPKPAPDVFLKAAAALGTAPEECLVVEDSCHGVHAAQNAGMPSIGFINPDSGDQDLSCATRQTRDFHEVDAAYAEEVYQAWKNRQ